MQYVEFYAVNHSTGRVLPGATITVYETGTTTLADLFDDAGAAIPNPTQADDIGLAQFAAADGVYDINVRSGSYQAPPITRFIIFDLNALKEQVYNFDLSAATGVTVTKETQALLFADLAHAPAVLALVYGDTDPVKRGIYVKSGPSGFGEWTRVAGIGNTGAKGDPGGNILAVGLFTNLAGLSVPVGTDLIQTAGYDVKGIGRALYVSVASGPATRYRAQTSNGRWFQICEVEPTPYQMGAKGDGVTDDQPAFQALFSAAAEIGLAQIYIPPTASSYLLGKPSASQVVLTGMTKSLSVRGAGDASLIKLKSGVMTADFQYLFTFTSADQAGIALKVSDLAIDANATGNPLPGGADPFAWQHNHCLFAMPTGRNGFKSVEFENILIVDPVADGCSVGGSSTNNVGSVGFRRIRAVNRNRVRSDICVTCSYDTMVVSDSEVVACEVETNTAASYNIGETQIVNLVCDTLDLMYKAYACPLQMTNVLVKKFLYLDGWKVQANNCRFQLSSAFRLGNFQTVVGVTHRYHSCLFRENSDFSDAANPHLMYMGSAATSPELIEFVDCDFEQPSGAPAIERIFYDWNTHRLGRKVIFRDNRFTMAATITHPVTFRSGDYHFEGNVFEGSPTSGWMLNQSTVSDFPDNLVRLINNTVKTSGIALLRPNNGLYECKFWMSGNTHVDGLGGMLSLQSTAHITPPRGTGAFLNFQQLDTGESNGKPTTGTYIRGHRVWYMAPTASGQVGAVCTVTGSPGTWKTFGAIEA